MNIAPSADAEQAVSNIYFLSRSRAGLHAFAESEFRRNPLVADESSAVAQRTGEGQLCSHWPVDCVAQIQAASHTLMELCALWVLAEPFSKALQFHDSGCIDLDVAPADAQTDHLMSRVAQAPAEIRALTHALLSLADEFDRVNTWLAKDAHSTWAAATLVRTRAGRGVMMGEDHRIVVMDCLGADMNALCASLLRRAGKVLDGMVWTSSALRADMAGDRAYEPVLQWAAGVLDRASDIALESAQFVQDFDQRWKAFRARISAAVALSRDTDPVPSTIQPPL